MATHLAIECRKIIFYYSVLYIRFFHPRDNNRDQINMTLKC